MIRSFEGTEPQVAESAHVHEAAYVAGDVVVEEDASVWPNATIRGDAGQVVVGEGSNLQDNAVMHEGGELGPDVTVGHSAIVHAAYVAEGALVVVEMAKTAAFEPPDHFAAVEERTYGRARIRFLRFHRT